MAIVSRGDGDLQVGMYVLFSKVFEDRPCLPEDFDYSILSELRDAGELPVLTVARPQMHPPIAEGSDFSAYSDTYYLLPRKEWFYIDLVTTLHGGASFEDHSEKPVFHGTEWGSAFKMIAWSQGFIPGTGTHSKKGKSYSGAWCVPTLPDALQRCQPDRYQVEGGLSRWCCPVVLEMVCSHLVRMGGRSTMMCCPGQIGVRHEGVRLQRIHFNIDYMQTYMAHEGFKVNAYLCQEATARLCGCGRCGLVTNSSCPDFRTWQKSRNNIWYTERCYSVAIAQTQTVL